MDISFLTNRIDICEKTFMQLATFFFLFERMQLAT